MRDARSRICQTRFHGGWRHVPSNTYITTGMDCAEKMDFGGCSAFASFKKGVARERKAYAGKRKARETLTALGMSVAIEYMDAGWGADFSEPCPVTGSPWMSGEKIIVDLTHKLVRYGAISPKQTAFLDKLVCDRAGQAERAVAQVAQRAAEAAASNYLGNVGERLQLTVTVRYTTSFETQFGELHVHLMADEAGNVVVYKGKAIGKRGDRITMKATVKEHGQVQGHEADGGEQAGCGRAGVRLNKGDVR